MFLSGITQGSDLVNLCVVRGLAMGWFHIPSVMLNVCKIYIFEINCELNRQQGLINWGQITEILFVKILLNAL